MRKDREEKGRRRRGGKGPRRLPPFAHPHGAEEAYARALVELASPWRRMLARLESGKELRFDAASGELAAVLAPELAAWIKKGLSEKEIRRRASRAFRRVSSSNDRTFKTWIDLLSGTRVGLDEEGVRARQVLLEEEMMRARIAENIKLINGVSRDLAEELAAPLQEAVRAGSRAPGIAELFAERLSVAESRLRLIGRDQVGKAHAEQVRVRQKSVGVRRYQWRTAGDERVRDRHQAINGQVFDWDEGHPTEGHPGEPIQCRCIAIPIIED